MKAVLMDCFGVATTEGRFLKETFYPMFPDHFEAQLEKAWMEVKTGRVSEEDFWEKFGYGQAAGRKALMARIKPNPKLREVMAYLKRKNYVVALFSELPKAWQDALVRDKGWRGLFDKTIPIPHLGYTKSQPPVYHWAQEQFGDCVIIDDSLAPLKLASRAGMETVWKKSIEQETSFEPDHVIRRLEELKGIL